MKIYKNGDKCPCCGQAIQGKSEEWLELFSAQAYFMGFREAGAQDEGKKERASNEDEDALSSLARNEERASNEDEDALSSLARNEEDLSC